jgi:hypothetical protein
VPLMGSNPNAREKLETVGRATKDDRSCVTRKARSNTGGGGQFGSISLQSFINICQWNGLVD